MGRHRLLKDDYVLAGSKKGQMVEIPDNLVELFVKNGAIADPTTGESAVDTTDEVRSLQEQLRQVQVENAGLRAAANAAEAAKATGPEGSTDVQPPSTTGDAQSNPSPATKPTRAEQAEARRAARNSAEVDPAVSAADAAAVASGEAALAAGEAAKAGDAVEGSTVTDPTTPDSGTDTAKGK